MVKVIEASKKDVSQYLFHSLNFFMVRSPILPMDFYKRLFLDDMSMESIITKIKRLSKDPFFQEAVFISSNSLYNSLRNWENITDNKKEKQILHSFCKYLIRMSTRPTPFGLFSGVSYGLLENSNSTLILNTYEYHNKRARPDMAWLFSIVQNLENDINVLEQLKVKTNNIVFNAGNRINIPYNSNCGQQNLDRSLNIESISIRSTPVTDIILNLAKQNIKVKEIVKLLKKKFPETDVKRINLVILQMIQKEYLLTELRPPLMSTSPFEYLLEKVNQIKGIEKLQIELNEIKNQINSYNKKKIGEGLNIIKGLNKLMKEVSKSKHPIQVDVKLSNQAIRLNQNVGNEISKVAEVLWKISPNSVGLPYLNEYREEFIEKYGTYREIPLLELLDEDHGLGAPATYNFPKSTRRTSQQENIHKIKQEQYLLKMLLEAYKKGSNKISLNDNDIHSLSHSDSNFDLSPDSLELYGTIMAENEKEIDKGNYQFVLGFNPGSDGAGKTFGRFIDILKDNTFIKEYKQIYESEARNENIIFAELVYLPSSGRAANVSLSENQHLYEVVIGTNSSKSNEFTIPVSDLVVGATLTEFYIKSKFHDKQVVLTLNHMLNIQSAPNIYRFLAEISSEGIRQWSPFMWHSLDSMPFLPRIEYGKSILSLAKWNINNKILKIKNTEFKSWKKAFYSWMDEWDMPRYVYQTLADNRVLLDLYNPLHIESLYTETVKLKDGHQISLVEKETSTLDSWSRDDKGNSYNIECVFPLLKNKKYKKQSNNKPKFNLKPIKTNSNTVRKFPGGKWLYIKLYGNASREEELISYYLNNMCNNLLNENVIDKYFFMRYADPKQHIRLRFHGNPERLNATVLPILNQWFYNLQDEGLIQNAEISTYEREVERYGGPKLINLAEEIFFYDSKVVSQLLFLTRIEGVELTLDEIATISVIHYLDSFGLSFKDQLSWFNSIVSYKEYLKDFRNNRQTFMRIGNNDDNWMSLRDSYINGNKILSILDQRDNSIKSFIKKMRYTHEQQELYNDVEDILGSIIHLHLNRLIGIDRTRETKIMTLVRHTLYNLRYIKEQSRL